MISNKGKTGIYLIQIGPHTYVGSAARCLYQRYHQHLNNLKSGKGVNPKMLRAYRKYNNIKFSVIEYWEPEFCISMEQYWMNLVRPTLNICPVAGSKLGKTITAATRAKMKSRKVSEETRALIREKRKQQVFSVESIQKRSQQLYKSIICSNGKTYPSLKSASMDLGIPASSISRVLGGYTASSSTRHGYSFSFATTLNEVI